MRIVKNYCSTLSSLSLLSLALLSACGTNVPLPTSLGTSPSNNPTASPRPSQNPITKTSPSPTVPFKQPEPVTTPVAADAPMKWINVLDSKEFSVEGLPWFSKTGVFRRLPADPQGTEFSVDVNQLANSTAGGQIRFRTTSPHVYVRVQLLGGSFMYHMPATGQSGIDLFDEVTGRSRFCGVARVRADLDYYESDLCYWANDGILKDVTLYLPLYNGLKKIEIGVAEGSMVIKPRALLRPGKTVIYGSSITQGAVASRPGLAWTNQLSRDMDQEIVNLGFSGAGLGEPALAKRIAEISDIKMVILDYEANAGVKIKDTLKPFIKLIREKHASIPIVVMSQIPWIPEFRSGGEFSEFRKELREYQRGVVNELTQAGDKNIYFIDGYSFMPIDQFEEGLVDGIHPSDIGHKWIADSVLSQLKQLGLVNESAR